MVGLPGTGLGGIFYGLLIFWMAVREAWLVFQAKSSIARWTMIGKLWILTLAIIFLFSAQYRFIQYMAENGFGGRLNTMHAVAESPLVLALAPTLATAPFLVLTIMIVLVRTSSWVLAPSKASK